MSVPTARRAAPELPDMADMIHDATLKATYESWVNDHAAALYRCAVRLCGGRDVAEELVQETFYHAWRSIASLKDGAKARGWLLRILRHRYAHWVRDQRRRPTSPWGDGSAADALPAGDPAPHEVLARQESLQAALNALENRYKEPFLLVFLEGMTCQGASRELGIPLGTVLSRIHRARAFLREFLEPTSNHSASAARHPPPRRGLAGEGRLGSGGAA